MNIRLAEITLGAPVALAPMAGITDLPFRQVVAGFGAGLVVSEMVASGELLTGRSATLARMALGLDGAKGVPTAVQLAGRDPVAMAEAARWAEGNGARIIDINMGCPARKVTGGLSGSALMREPDRALAIVAAVVGAVRVPVTLKMRLGWDDGSHNAAPLARAAAGAGVRMVTVHGRTRCQFYTGRADWAAIAPVVAAAGVPVIANGDIAGAATARAALAASGAAGVMIGRGAQGRPWLPAQVAAALAGRPVTAAPRGAALADLVAGHLDAAQAFHGAAHGLRSMRKHLGWYLEAAGADPGARRAILTAADAGTTMRLLRSALADAPGDGAGDAAGDPALRCAA
ncbi:MAG: tRNA dihydrouridine synthase DusB [Gemmobacter sp.]